jgi:phytoene dehydrogenase-like protein
MSPLISNWQKLVAEFLQPILHIPRHPFTLARFGLRAIWPATVLANALFKDEQARALFAGIAAHSFLPLEAVASAAFGIVLGTAAHAVGWPMPRGGAQSLPTRSLLA